MEQTDHLALPVPRRWRDAALDQVGDALATFVDTCVHPVVVVPLFLASMTDSSVTVGVALAFILAATALAYPVGAALERRAAYQQGGLIGAFGLRALALYALAGVAMFAGPGHAPPLALAVFLFVAIGLLGGFARPLRLELASGTSAEAPLGGLRARWALAGGVAAVLGALAARPLLVVGSPLLPASYARLLILAGLILTLATTVAVLLRPAAPAPPRGFLADARAFPGLVFDNLAYGRFLFFRVLYAIGAIADPFYILYATRELGGSGRAAGAYLLALAVTRAVAVLVWRSLRPRWGNQLVLQLSAFVRVLAPIVALTLPPLLGAAALRDRLPGDNAVSLVAFGLVFVAYGAAGAGLDLAAPALQAAITAPRERLDAAVVTNLALALGALSIIVGGVIVDRFGYAILFIVALIAGLAALLACGLLEEPGLVVMRAPPGERAPLRRRRRPARDV